MKVRRDHTRTGEQEISNRLEKRVLEKRVMILRDVLGGGGRTVVVCSCCESCCGRV